MKLKTHIPTPKSAVALVITLLMLSVITFLAVAFLAMTARDKSAVTASLDVDTARSMSDAALARAQTEIIAQMMIPPGDILRYDYMASHNYVSPYGFSAGDTTVPDSNNVCYDTLVTNGGSGANAQAWAQNIANLLFDPRPPVFVMTNGNQAQPSNDFRFWVDINRNGRFETNGTVTNIDSFGNAIGASAMNGEPEWIGVLKYPDIFHSASNPFIGRYAYMVLPIGKTLDFNYIYNNSRFANSPPSTDIGPGNTMKYDGFIRDEGVGSWELNLAAVLENISPEFQTNNYLGLAYGANPYYYSASTALPALIGAVNYDAAQFLGFRYGYNPGFPQTLSAAFGVPPPNILNTLISVDEYGSEPNPSFEYPIDYFGTSPTATTAPWPGSYNSNMLYDVQDLFDTTKTGPNFSINLAYAGSQIDTANRYAFQRLLGSIGTGSSPEYGVYVYSNFYTTNITPSTPFGYFPIPAPGVLRTKVNINYDNTAQIQSGPVDTYGKFTPMPTNIVTWTNTQNNGLNFFTVAAESLLRSQVFIFTNSVLNAQGQYVQAGTPYGFIYTNFGLTNIPVYLAGQPGIVYNEQVHRMLQLAANIFAAAFPVYSGTGLNLVQQPPVFRPLFNLANAGTQNAALTIIGYTNVTAAAAYNQVFNGNWKDRTNQTIGINDNVWGVPWIVGAVKGNPQFDQCSYQNQVSFNRQLLFVRLADKANPGKVIVNTPPKYTNQFYELAISGVSGMDAWNPYTNAFSGSLGTVWVVASNYITITVTNNYNWGTNVSLGTSTNANIFNSSSTYWPGGLTASPNMFKTFLSNNILTLPSGYFSESRGTFIPFTNGASYFLAADTNQTTFPTHIWSMTVTNHLYYLLLDGPRGTGNVLDFVNLGPFGSSFPITQYLTNYDPNKSMWFINPYSDSGIAQPPGGVTNQINAAYNYPTFGTPFYYALHGMAASQYNNMDGQFGPPTPSGTQNIQLNTAPNPPYAIYSDTNIWMACDPLVHYTVGDLTSLAQNFPTHAFPLPSIFYSTSTNALTLSTGAPTQRYLNGITNGGVNNNIVFGDPGMISANNWQFPTSIFPSVGWLGRVHRGTPWQTIYLKSDNPSLGAGWSTATNHMTPWVNPPVVYPTAVTYPTNDWSLIDLFTAVPNDNAARGLLSVNQTNDAAWAAVFAGVIALTNNSTVPGTLVGVAVNPTNDVFTLMDAASGLTNGINIMRTNVALYPNALFHHVGDILGASALTVNSPFLTNVPVADLTDEMVERIPQQTLGLLKVGMPQFVIYAWGQSLKPKTLYSGGSANLNNICTNYEITGEFLTRTVCHVVSDSAVTTPKIVVDNYNIMPGN